MTAPYYQDPTCSVFHGDCVDVMRGMPDRSIDAICTDPPYSYAFMSREWDSHETPHAFQAWCETWAAEALRVLRPGGHMLAFGGTRTFHRLTCAIEDAGFEIRDSIAWLYGSGFPKSLNVPRIIDKAARGVPQGGPDPTSPNHGGYRTTKTEGKRWDGDSGQGYGAGGSRFLTATASVKITVDGTESTPALSAAAADGPPNHTQDATANSWNGWGTALKPAHEPIVVARKPLAGTVAANVTRWGTGAINIDGCRVGTSGGGGNGLGSHFDRLGNTAPRVQHGDDLGGSTGRWPSNVVLTHSASCTDRCVDGCPVRELDQQSGVRTSGGGIKVPDGSVHGFIDGRTSLRNDSGNVYNPDTGSASRFFPTFRYEAKAPTSERPTVGKVTQSSIPNPRCLTCGRLRLNYGESRCQCAEPDWAVPEPGGIAHPTVKPLSLVRWLCRLVTPPDGTVLDPFAGSGTTLEAAMLEGFNSIGIEQDADYLPLIAERIRRGKAQGHQPDLFGGAA